MLFSKDVRTRDENRLKGDIGFLISGCPLCSEATKEVSVVLNDSTEFEPSSSVLLSDSRSHISRIDFGDAFALFVSGERPISSVEKEFSLKEFISDHLQLD